MRVLTGIRRDSAPAGSLGEHHLTVGMPDEEQRNSRHVHGHHKGGLCERAIARDYRARQEAA